MGASRCSARALGDAARLRVSGARLEPAWEDPGLSDRRFGGCPDLHKRWAGKVRHTPPHAAIAHTGSTSSRGPSCGTTCAESVQVPPSGSSSEIGLALNGSPSGRGCRSVRGVVQHGVRSAARAGALEPAPELGQIGRGELQSSGERRRVRG